MPVRRLTLVGRTVAKPMGGRSRHRTRRVVPGLSDALAVYCADFGQQWNSARFRGLAVDYAAGAQVPTYGELIWRALFNPMRPRAGDEWLREERLWLVSGEVAELIETGTGP